MVGVEDVEILIRPVRVLRFAQVRAVIALDDDQRWHGGIGEDGIEDFQISGLESFQEN